MSEVNSKQTSDLSPIDVSSSSYSSFLNSTNISSSTTIISPTKTKSRSSIYPNADSLLHLPIETYATLNVDNELTRLELETLDDFVLNALGSFQISASVEGYPYEPPLPRVETIGPSEKYTVHSASSRDSTHSHRHVGRDVAQPFQETERAEVDFDDQNEIGRVINQTDSGISSATTTDYPTSPKVFVIEHTLNPSSHICPPSQENITKDDKFRENLNSMKEPLRKMESVVDAAAAKKTSKNPTKVEVNGSIVGGDLLKQSVVSGLGNTLRRHPHLNLRHKSESVIGTTDMSILRSELLTAVELNKVDKVRRILNTGVDPNSVCDEKGRWPLHIACVLGYPAITKLLLEHGAEKDQPDTALERTPLLYAATTSKETVQVLLSHRVDIQARNKFGATAIHYAAGAGQGECCRLLASAGCDVNGRDRQKMTPLLMAARVDDTWSIDILLEYGADIHAQDAFGKTALHHAAETCEGIESDYGKMGATFRKLVSAGVAVNAVDQDGKTGLYYAIQTGSEEAVMILYELGAELMDGISLLTMSKKFPHIIPPFMDKCVSSNIDNCDVESKQFYIQFDYTCLTVFPKDIPNDKLLSMQNREERESILREMGVLHGLTRCKDSSILSHPVCESLLRLKWKKVKWYLYLDMLLFAVFLAFLTAVIFMEYESDNPRIEDSSDNSTSEFNSEESMLDTPATSHGIGHERYCMDSARNIAVWSILWVLTALLGIREMIQLIQAPLHYVVQVENMLELVLVSSVALLSLAECGVKSFVEARDHFAAVCLIVGWTIQVTLYGKIPVFGVYIRMFAAVAVNILKCMFTYLGLLFAFSLTLHFLFRTQKDFDSVGFTFLKTFAMMIGEIDLARTFIDSRSKNAVIVPFTSHLVVALFIIFISIILSSLFLALAVCDISSMQREGEYMQLVQQVKVSSQLEDALQKRSLLYPQFGMRDIRSLHQRKGVIFPNLKDHGKLSKDAVEIVMTQHTKKQDPSRRGITQPTHMDHTNAMMTKASNDITDDILQKVKDGMDKYSQDMDKKMIQTIQDIKSQDRGSNQLSREVLLIKSQLEDMNKCLREISVLVTSLADRALLEIPSPLPPSRKKVSRDSHAPQRQRSSPDESAVEVPAVTNIHGIDTEESTLSGITVVSTGTVPEFSQNSS